MTLPVHLALVSEESAISLDELSEVAAALQKQVVRDFGPLWRIDATVSAFASLDHLPLDYWPIIIRDDIDDPSALGYHTTRHGQPYSLVRYGPGWTHTASHETLEMLADPFGNRLIAGPSPAHGQGRVKFLAEVCDPCESVDYSYTINDITVSDFYTPQFFDPQGVAGARYSFTGALSAPRQVLPGGYLSWFDPASNHWWQRTWWGGAHPADAVLQLPEAPHTSLRSRVDRATTARKLEALQAAGQSPSAPATTERPLAQGRDPRAARAASLRETLAAVLGG